MFSQSKNGRVVLILDIGSGSVGAGLALLSERQSPMLLYTTRRDIPFQEEATAPRLLSLMLRTLSEVFLDVASEGMPMAGFSSKRPRLREVFVVLGAPWIISNTAFLHFTSENSVTINETMLRALIHEHEKENAPPKGTSCIEQKLVRASLNGYRCATPFRKNAKRAEFGIFKSFSSEKIIRKIREIALHIIGADDVSFHSFSLMNLTGASDLFPECHHFLLLDVRGELTELSVVKNDTIVDTVSFPFGRNTLLRMLQKKTGAPVSGISGILTLRSEEKAVGKLHSRVERELSVLQDEWLRDCRHALSSFSSELLLPTTIFLMSNDDTLPFFTATIKRSDWNTFMPAVGPVEVIPISLDRTSSAVRWNSHARHDSFLALEALASSQLLST